MTLFIVIGALLVALTLAALTRPLWRAARHGATPPVSSALDALRQQLAQLTALKQSGVLGDAAYDEARHALERRIADAVVNAPAPAARPAPAPANSKPLLLGLGAFVVAVTIAGYLWIGTPQALDAAVAAGGATPTGAAPPITAAQVETMIENLAARLKDKPDDADGWAMLGRAYAMLGRHEQSAPALKQAVALRGDNAVLLTDYADALAMANGRNLEGEPSRLIDKALAIEPNNLKALSLAGTIAFNRKDFPGAIRHWEKMVQLDPNSELAQQIRGGIDEARRLAGIASPAAGQTAALSPTAPTAPTASVSVSGTVTLDAKLAAKARPDDTLFVFARAAEGPRMPLAILRKQVKDLPLTFTLDDSMAMTPAARLSSASRVVVGARISARGDATPQPGDLQGFSAPVAPGAAGLNVKIGEVVAGP